MQTNPSALVLGQLEAAFRAAPTSRLFAPLADAYRRAGKLQQALELLQKGTQRHPDYVSAWVLLGLCQRDLAGSPAAEITFARVLSMDPENLVALKHRARRDLEENDAATAGAIVERVLEIDPYDREALVLRDEVASHLQERPSTEEEPVATLPPSRSEEPRPTSAETTADFQATADTEPPVLDLQELVAEEEPSENLPAAAKSVDADLDAEWQVQRDADRIVIRPRGETAPAAAPPRADEFSTLTLARIYESQGYDDKALTIYETLVQREPNNPELRERLRLLQERLGRAGGSAPARSEDEPAAPRWRLLDAEKLSGETEQTAEQLRQLADRVRDREEDKRHTVIGRSPAKKLPAAPVSDVTGSDEPDFERFLRYVRSLKR